MKIVFKWLERLSLDAALVAGVWGVALARIAERTGFVWEILILCIATWLTYVADRLWEVRRWKCVPETDRHLYYKSNYKSFASVWAVIFLLSIVVSLIVLPGWKVQLGLLLVAAIVVYLWKIGTMLVPSRKLLLKRIVVPVVFCAGVVLMAECWRTVEGLVGAAVLFSSALENVFLISYWENHDKREFAWLEKWTMGALLVLMVIAHIALVLFLPIGLAGLLCTGIYFWLLIRIKAGQANNVRAWVDGIMVVAAVLVVVIS